MKKIIILFLTLLTLSAAAQDDPLQQQNDYIILDDARDDMEIVTDLPATGSRDVHEFRVVIHVQVQNANQYCNIASEQNYDAIGPGFIADLNAKIVEMNTRLAHSGVFFTVCPEVIYTIDQTALDFQDPSLEANMTARHQPGRFNLYVVQNIVNANGYAYIGPSAERIFIERTRALTSTLWHEFGHALGLRHTHGFVNGTLTSELVDGSNCTVAGDRICDTPADPQLSSSNVDANCNYTGSLMDSNGDLFNPDVQNILSYAPGQCRDHYSNGQMDVVRNLIETFGWHSSKILSCEYDLEEPAGPTLCADYNAVKVEGTMVSGDFDEDGDEDDVAALYNYGGTNSSWHVWTGEGDHFELQGTGTPFWQSTGFDANKVKYRVASGDFDNDGFKDDIVTFYYYGGDHTRAFVFISDGTQFAVNGAGWWDSPFFDGDNIQGCVVSGDFDHDLRHDDVAVLYDYGGLHSSFFLFEGTVNGFNSWGPVWTSYSFAGQETSKRLVSGDFDEDGFHDDITGIYDYSNFVAKWHVWRMNTALTNIQYDGVWYTNNNYEPSELSGRVVVIDADHDGFVDDVTGMYDYGGWVSHFHTFKGNKNHFAGTFTSWTSNGYGAHRVKGRVMSGDFDGDGHVDDVTAFYDYGLNGATNLYETRAHLWKANSPSVFEIDNHSRGWWGWCCANDGNRLKQGYEEVPEWEEVVSPEIKVYPNPADDRLTIEGLDMDSETRITLYDAMGRTVLSSSVSGKTSENLDVSNAQPGLYFLIIENGLTSARKSVVIR